MKKKLDMKSLTIGALIGAFVFVTIAATTSPRGRTVWEYKTVENYANRYQNTADGPYYGLDVDINAAIADGWEFVSASGTGNPNVSSPGRGFAILKRRIKHEEK